MVLESRALEPRAVDAKHAARKLLAPPSITPTITPSTSRASSASSLASRQSSYASSILSSSSRRGSTASEILAEAKMKRLQTEHDAFADLMKFLGSPIKASSRAAKHILGQAKRVPLHSMLDRLEAAVGVSVPSPKIAPTRRFAIVPAKVPSNHINKHICELYEAFVVRNEVEQSRNASGDKGSRSQSSARGKSGRQAASQPPTVDSFLDVLKVYYPTFSKATLQMMVDDAKEGLDLIDRRKFIQRAKGTLADRLKLAFSNSDKDKSGGLNVDEFVKSVEATGAHPPGYSPSRPCPKEQLSQIVKKIFSDGDLNSDGILDFDEFLELCSKQPWLVNAFDRIVELGVRRKLKNEETRLGMIFRVPISPRSRLVLSPSTGRKYRPGLYDLRRAEDVGSMMPASAKS